MKIKFSLLTVVAVLAGLVASQPASAASSSIKVTTTPKLVNICRPNAEQVRFQFEFSAKIKKKHTSNPKSVNVTFTVEDAATGATLASGRVTLTAKNKWKKQSTPVTAQAGEALTYKLKSQYRAPNTGKMVKATATLADSVPSADQMDQANAASPSAPPYPACV